MDEPIYIIDHLIVMGIDPELTSLSYSKIKNSDFSVDFIDIYPLKLPEIPKYLDNYQNWCFPEGFKVFDETIKLINESTYSEYGSSMVISTGLPNLKFSYHEEENFNISSKESLAHFVMTDEKYIKRYCSNLLIYEKFYIKHDDNYKVKKQLSKLIPKMSISSIIRNPLVLNDETDMIYVPKSISLISRIPVFELQKNLLHYFYKNHILSRRHQEEKIITIPNYLFQEYDNIIASFGLYQGEHEFKIKVQSKIDSLPADCMKNSVKIKETKLKEFYISMIFSLFQIKEEDCEISFLKLFKDRNEELLRFRINNGIGINLANFSYKPLFTRLTLDNIIKIIKFILLEKQLLFFSSFPAEIPLITESLLSLISPLTWMNIYIPFLPIPMWETLHAIFPFIIGMSKNYLKFILENLCVGDKVIIDLDENIIYSDDDMQELLLPQSFKDYIISQMSVIMQGHKEYKDNVISKNNLKWEEMMLKTKQVFWNAMLCLFNNYEDSFKYEKLDVECSFNSGDIFDFANYLTIFPPTEYPFMDELSTKTMMFPKFLEDSYKIVLRKHFMEHPRVSFIEDDNSMFLNNIVHLKSHMAIKKNQYMDFFQHPEYYTFLEQLQSGKIAEILNKCSHPEKRSLMPYLIKYLRYSEFLKKAEILLLPSQNDSKTSLKQTKITINSEKLNQDNQLFSKLSKSRIINLDNVGNGVVLAYLEYMSKIENGKIDSLMIPNSFDLNHFNNIYQNQDPDELKSPEIKSTLKMLPKVLTISSNLETNTKAASFVILNKKNSFPDIESRENQSLHEKKNISSTHSSAFINQNENVNILSPMISIKNINSNNDINQESNKFKLKIFNTDFGYKGHSPSSPSNKLLNKIQNFGIYYHTVKRNVNPENNHKRQYSKSIHVPSSKIHQIIQPSIYPTNSMPYAALKKFSEESPLIKSICNKNNETLTISEEKENEKEEPISVELKNLKMINRKKARLISAMEFPSHIIDQFKKDANFSQYINFWSGKKNPLAANIFHKFKFQYPKRTTYKSLSPVKNEGNFTFHFPETEIIKENNLDQSLKSLEISGDLDSMQEEIFDIIDEKYQKTKENSNSIIKRSSYDRNKTLFMDQLHEEMSPLKGNQIKSVKFKKNVSQDNRVKFNLPLEDEVQRANSFDNRK